MARSPLAACSLAVALALSAFLSSTVAGLAQPATTSDDILEMQVGLAIMAYVAIGIFLTPTVIAFVRGHPNRWPIMLINIVFGFTILGWFGALIWAAGAVHKSTVGSHGGESGLNLFANDPHTVRIAAPPASAKIDTSDISHRLRQLKQLHEEGAISGEEFERLRLSLLDRLG